jgi:hypothetical protein
MQRRADARGEPITFLIGSYDSVNDTPPAWLPPIRMSHNLRMLNERACR